MNKDAFNVYLITLCFFILTWAIVPIVPRYVMSLGGDPTSIGVVMSAAPTATIATRVLFSIMSDLRSRVFMMRLGTLLLGISYLILYLSKDINTLILGRLVQGLSLASFIPPSIAYVVDIARRGVVGRALGTRALMASLGYTLGPFLGGLISELLGYKSLFIITSISAFIMVPMIKLNDSLKCDTTFKDIVHEMAKVLRHRSFILLFISTSFQTIILASVIPFLSSYLKITGYSDYEAGIVSSAYGISGLLSRVLMSFCTDRNVMSLALLALGIDAVGLAMLSYFPLPPLAFIPVLLIGFGDGIFVPSTQALVFINTKTELRSVLSGMYASSWDLGMLVGPLIAGYLITMTGDYLITFRYLMVFTLASSFFLLMERKFIKQ
ncbi:MAG: MFS transporter [Sulfolobales archaeon]|nr:MFS transporter [Sulfolobales archaeon]